MLRVKNIDLEQFRSDYVKPDGSPQDPSYIGGIVLEDGEASIRFKPSLDQCNELWSLIEPSVIEWAKALINGEPHAQSTLSCSDRLDDARDLPVLPS